MNKDDKPILKDTETGELLSKNELLFEFTAWKRHGIDVGKSFDDFIKKLTAENGPCKWIKEN